MRQRIIFGLVSLASVAVAGCNNNNPENAVTNVSGQEAAQLYTVIAGPVTGNRAGGINGSFQITEASAPDGIESDLMGGACIMFRARDLRYDSIADKSCNNDSQCKAPGAVGDCHPDTHTCWARPEVIPPSADPLCKRSLTTGLPWPPDTDNMISSSGIPVPENLLPDAQAVVVACLKGAGSPGASDASPASTICGQPHSLVKWGTPTTIP